MHIKDLKTDIELTRTALATIRGGSGPAAYYMPTQQPELPSFNGDWSKFNADVMRYVESARAGYPGGDSGPYYPTEPVLYIDDNDPGYSPL